MQIRRRVSVERNRLRFAAAHFATFHGDCEPLHGHNYELIVEVEGELDENSWVWDFGDLKREARTIADRLDHRFLLQRASRALTIVEHPDRWEVTFRDRHFVFPAADVIALPIDNSTTERLAEWVGGQLWEYLQAQKTAPISKLTVGVEEMPGQAGWYSVDVQVKRGGPRLEAENG